MREATIVKIVTLFSSLISFSSAFIALFTGGDIFFVIVVRFLAVFFISAILIWTALSLINSTIVRAATVAVDEFREEMIREDNEKIAKELASSVSESLKGQNLDLTSANDSIDLAPLIPNETQSEISEFEPFKPTRL